MDKARHEKRTELAVFLLYLLLSYFVALLYPISGDDWQWGAGGFAFASFNGRYAGNIFVQLLLRSGFLRPVFIAGTITALTFGTARLAGGRHSRYIALALILLLPQAIYTQAFQWTSGFANYTLSAAALLSVIFAATRPRRVFLRALALPLAFMASLFAEHITIAAFLLSLGAVVYSAAARKRSVGFLFAFAGFAAGAAVMFSNPAYRSFVRTSAHAMPRLLELAAAAAENFGYIASNFVLGCTAAMLALCVLLIAVIRRSRRSNALRSAFSAFFAVFAAWTVVCAGNPSFSEKGLLLNLECALVIVFAAAVFASIALFTGGIARVKLLFCAAAIVLLTAPLLFVNPIGPRCFFVIYCVYTLMACLLASEADLRLPRAARCAVFALAAAMFFSKLFVYGDITRDVNARERYIAAQLAAGDTVVVVPAIENHGYVWVLNPYSDYNKSIFRDYYGIPEDVTIECR